MAAAVLLLRVMVVVVVARRRCRHRARRRGRRRGEGADAVAVGERVVGRPAHGVLAEAGLPGALRNRHGAAERKEMDAMTRMTFEWGSLSGSHSISKGAFSTPNDFARSSNRKALRRSA